MDQNDSLVFERWVRHRDAEAFRELVQRYSTMVYATCRRVLGNATDAEDVTQECFETLAQAHRVPTNYLGPWLHRIAVNLSLNRVRGESRRRRRETTYFQSRPQTERPDWDDIYLFVDEAMAQLPEALRAPLIAHFLEGQSHAEVAARLGVSRQTITHRLHQGTERVRTSLRKKGIVVASTFLAMALTEIHAEASPATLTASLGKIAIAGAVKGGGGSTITVLAAGGSILMKKAIVVTVIALVVAGATYHFAKRSATPQAPPLPNPTYTPLAQAPAPVERAVPAATTEAAPGVPAGEPDLSKGAISGRVVETGSEVPVADIIVVAEMAGSAKLKRSLATTDAQGNYRIDDLAPGTYVVLIEKRNQWPGTSENSRVSVQVRAGALLERVDFTIARYRNISGRVMNLAGKPLPNISVMCVLEHTGRSGKTNEKGEYMVEFLPDAAFSVQVSKIDGKTVNAGDIPGGVISDVPAGSEGVDFHIDLGVRAAIDGRVVNDDDNTPVTDFEILALDGPAYKQSWEGQKFTRVQDKGGAFHLKDLLSGSVMLVARAPGFSETPLTMPDVAGGSVTTDVTIRLTKGLAVNGVVQDRLGAPIPKAAIYSGAGPAILQPTSKPIAQSDEHGRFSIKNLDSSVGELTALAEGYASNSVTLDLANRSKPVLIVLTQGGAIDGHIHFDGQPWADQRVTVAVPRGSGGDTVQSDAKGAFRVERLPVGPVMVIATVPLAPGDTSGKERRMIVNVTVVDGADSKVELDFQALTASLAGAITEDGAPKAGVTVTLTTATGDTQEQFTSSVNAQGEYSFAMLPVGAAVLQVLRGPKLGSTSVEVQLEEGTVVTRNIDLSQGATVAGTVSGMADGEETAVILVTGDAPQRTTDVRTYIFALTAFTRANTQAQPDGSYRFTGVQPGKYTLLAFAASSKNLVNAREARLPLEIADDSSVNRDIAFK